MCRSGLDRLWQGAWLVAALVAIGGCERSAPPTPPSGPTASPAMAELPADLWLSAEPANAVSVRAAKLDAAPGREVAVRGRIGGRREPFIAGSAVFQLVDKALPMCSEKHGDGCPTPWDYCCESREDVLASSATVQVVDAQGRPLRVGLEGRNGLNPGAEIIVTGTVAGDEGDETLVLTARGFFVVTR